MKHNEPVVATVASFRNFPSENSIKDSIVIFWESHTNNPTDKERIKSTIDLISKRFDLSSCEKYEVRTGYLSRYNYLSKTLEESSIDELQEAIIKGEEEQTGWIERCSPKMPEFKQINWPECVSPRKNPHFIHCREVLRAKIKENEKFFKAYRESADAYAIKRHTNPENGFSYLVEENSWIMSLPLLYPNKKIYIIHVGNVTDSTLILFSEFEYLKKSAMLLFPSFTHETFASICDFKIEYENKNQFGYFIDGFDFSKNNIYSGDYTKNIKVELLTERAEKELLSNIIAQLPGHIYWMNIKGKYIGCNDLQAEHLGLKSRNQILNKTVFDLLPPQEAIKHNNINKLVIERGRSYSGKEKVSTKEGLKTYLSTKVPLENTAGERVGLLGVSVDITDRENARAIQKQNEAKKYELEKQKELQKQ
ncbi:MAG: PAS domain-containing protein, partial [Alphaproteobacteria bacterium]|nr:PAS domain-containing protein [Alphaproteobacteria bacterium]